MISETIGLPIVLDRPPSADDTDLEMLVLSGGRALHQQGERCYHDRTIAGFALPERGLNANIGRKTRPLS